MKQKRGQSALFPCRIHEEGVVGVKVVRLRTERENAAVSIAGNNRVNFGDRLLV